MHDHQDILSSLDTLEQELDKQIAETQVEMPVADSGQSLEDTMQQQILKLLHEHPDAPTESKIKEWKNSYGQNGLQVVALDQENVFVYTHLTLAQWDKIDSIRKKLNQAPGMDQESAEKKIKEHVLKTCILWPTLGDSFFQNCRAGLPSTLFELIMINSYFLTPQQALSLTTKL